MAKTCANCGQSHLRQGRYCSNGCKQDAYRQRHGIGKPDFLVSKKRQTFLMPEEERELQLLEIEIEALEPVVKEQNEKYRQWLTGTGYKMKFPSLTADGVGYKYSDEQVVEGNRYVTVRTIEYSLFTFYSVEQLKAFLQKPGIVLAFKVEAEVKEKCGYRGLLRHLQQLDDIKNKRDTVEGRSLVEKKKRRYQLVRNAEIRIEKKPEDGVTGGDLAKKKFSNLAFDGKWKELLGLPTANFYGIVWGDGKSGKSFFTIELAQYLTMFGKVAYMSFEEGLEQTIQVKVKEKQAYDITLFDCSTPEQMVKHLEYGFDFVVVDSATKADISAAYMEELRLKCPQSAFLVILQTVKGGKNFKGEQDWKHNAQFIVTVERIEKGRKQVSCEGRFGQGLIVEEF